ncbi:hypothetical protein E2C01_100711 [Portunus trituberculatus]|uniref:Uncharacterized protein n=1 Tax=Portunus trituberculatus TaxID=210409 RepID=A0A5B7KE06_PORTR|nr:hypothetical protein [Portunus trituberculatus]
MSFCSVTYLAH